MKTEENGFVTFDGDRPVVMETVHPLPNLLDLGAEGVLESMCRSQKSDFTAMVAEIEHPGSPLHVLFADLRNRVPADHPFHGVALFRKGALQEMFLDLHDHVMSHPVWLHPFFVRVFEGRINSAQVAAFAVQYFSQIKNTRQCVAMAIGRFHGLTPLPYGILNERVSEITQVALAQLVADEYGVGSRALEDYPDLCHLLLSKTHIAMYRQLFEGLGVPPDQQDVAMLPGVADNVLTQRLVASHPAFSPLEALSSVGLGMEWGVPEFFSLLLGGFIRVALREKLPWTPRHLEVFIAHVRYDVLHAISVMLATSLHMQRPEDISAVKGACNTLMAGRFAMMTDLYRHVFGERCAALADIDLDLRHRLRDRRIESLLLAAREAAAPGRVLDERGWRASRNVPYIFA